MTRSTLLQATAVLSLFASSALARVVNYNFNVANGQVAPDGVTRDAVLVNGRFPGPLITANRGDTLKITVKNGLTSPSMRRSTTIHWHGLFQSHTAQLDGPAFVTQCPIAPQDSYTYTIPLNDQTGTYWYHSHLSAQYVDGLRGPLVIYDPQDPYLKQYDVDDETTVLTLADWYHTASEAIMATGLVAATIPNSGTINGKGRYDPLNITASPDTLYTLKVQRGKRYRLRIINASAIASFRFGIQGHKMTVIEADGIMTKPIEVDQFDILAGQRYSVIVKADQTPDTYWINAPITNVLNTNVQALFVYEDVKPWRPPKGPYWTWAISQNVVNYWKHTHGHHGGGHKGHKRRMIGASRGASGLGSRHELEARHASEPELEKRVDATALALVVLDEKKLVPLENPGAPGGSKPADVVVPLNFGLNFSNGRWMINNISYVSPDVPTLLQILASGGAGNFTDSEHTVKLPRNKIVEFYIFGSALGIVHPMHFHGHAFDVVQFGNDPPNYVNPPRRDVVGVSDAGVRIRFKTDNPGPWFLHCHIDWHLEEGLAMVFAEAPSDIPKLVKPDPAWYKLCENYNQLSPDLQ
ncbi:laccase, multicopper oxidase, benzenediol:oxygen oxidorectuctase [Ceratobasidium sp. 414]|nr:laccase, multicopper oxidase, benzenediol:oxygen oxidorectuctase [Ceratobasidium sp. 414]